MELQLTTGGIAIINDDDFERELFVEFRNGFVWRGTISGRPWWAAEKSHTSYAISRVQVDCKQYELRLHRLVLCARKGDVVDHVNGNGLDCRRLNLRFVSTHGNAHNTIAQRGSSSRFKGVSFHKQSGRWSAQIRHERRKIHLGLYATEAEAAAVYDMKARELFGETALLNGVC